MAPACACGGGAKPTSWGKEQSINVCEDKRLESEQATPFIGKSRTGKRGREGEEEEDYSADLISAAAMRRRRGDSSGMLGLHLQTVEEEPARRCWWWWCDFQSVHNADLGRGRLP